MSENHSKEQKSVEENISEDYIPKQKIGDLPLSNNISADLKKEMEKTKEEIDKFKKELIKKFKYIESMGVIPAQASSKIEEEYEIPKEDCDRKLIHILVVIPEDKYKEIGKVKLDAIQIAKSINDKFWIHILTSVDIWNLCLDSKFEVSEALAMSFPIIDKGILGALRVAEIHKTLILRKFEKYVTTYVISGSLVRGEAHADSDVDVFVVIDDTDVKRMSRLELREKIRGIVYSYIQEATAIAGVKNILNVQVYLLTDFWESVKDAHPVMFTFIRDGVPLYDRGAFLPWKSLLKMGKIKPSPEAIDMFMSSGDKLNEVIERRLLDIVMGDIYWGVLTPTQGLLMLYGLSPPTPKETVKLVREVIYEKEKMIEKKYVDILETIVVKYYKGYEHGKIKKVSGKEVDELTKDAIDYINRLKELRKQIETRVQQKSIKGIYDDVFKMLEALLNKKTENSIIQEFNDRLIKTGKFPLRFFTGLKFIAKTKSELEKEEAQKIKKSSKKAKISGKEIHDVEKARKYSAEIVNALIEYTQRCDFLAMDRTRFLLKSEDKSSEVFFLDDVFVVQGAKISKLQDEKLADSNTEELKKQLLNHREKETKINYSALNTLKKILGNFELIY